MNDLNRNELSNKQLYRSAFSKLHTSEKFIYDGGEKEMTEKNGMNKRSIRVRKSFITITVVLVLIFAMTCIGYAATDGQLFDNIKVMINGTVVASEQYENGETIKVEISGEGNTKITDENSGAEVSVDSYDDANKGSISFNPETGESNLEINQAEE